MLLGYTCVIYGPMLKRKVFAAEASPDISDDNVELETFKLKCKLSIGLLIFDAGLNCVYLFGHLDVVMFCLLFGALQLILFFLYCHSPLYVYYFHVEIK
jgi:hypothetical protein